MWEVNQGCEIACIRTAVTVRYSTLRLGNAVFRVKFRPHPREAKKRSHGPTIPGPPTIVPQFSIAIRAWLGRECGDAGPVYGNWPTACESW